MNGTDRGTRISSRLTPLSKYGIPLFFGVIGCSLIVFGELPLRLIGLAFVAIAVSLWKWGSTLCDEIIMCGDEFQVKFGRTTMRFKQGDLTDVGSISMTRPPSMWVEFTQDAGRKDPLRFRIQLPVFPVGEHSAIHTQLHNLLEAHRTAGASSDERQPSR